MLGSSLFVATVSRPAAFITPLRPSNLDHSRQAATASPLRSRTWLVPNYPATSNTPDIRGPSTLSIIWEVSRDGKLTRRTSPRPRPVTFGRQPHRRAGLSGGHRLLRRKAARTTRAFRVVEAPTPSRALRRRKGESDQLDALHAAQAVLPLQTDRLIEAKTVQVITALRVLSVARDGMTRQRTAAINTLTALLRTVELGVDVRKPLTTKQIQQVAAWRPRRESVAERVTPTEAVRLARSILSLRGLLDRNAQELNDLAREMAPDLLALPGIGPVNAAVILASWSHPGRVRSEAAFAALAGPG